MGGTILVTSPSRLRAYSLRNKELRRQTLCLLILLLRASRVTASVRIPRPRAPLRARLYTIAERRQRPSSVKRVVFMEWGPREAQVAVETPEARRHWSITSTTLPREFLEVLLLQQRQYQLLSIRNSPSKASSNAPGSGMRQRTISSSSYHISRSTSISLSFPKRWPCVLTRRRRQRPQPLTKL